MTFNLDPALTFETWVVGPGNQLAVAAARRSAESPGTYNPLVLMGPAGVGKTHLLHALGQRALEVRPKLKLVHETVESFAARMDLAVAAGRFEAFRSECMRVDLLLLDDGGYLAGRLRLQNELLPIWDRMGQHGGQVVLATDLAPASMDGLHVRLEGRFARMLIAELQPKHVQHSAVVVSHAPPLAPLRVSEPPSIGTRTGNGQRLALPAPAALRSVGDVEADRPLQNTKPDFGRGAGAHLAEPRDEDLFASFLDDIATTVAEVVDAAPWKNRLAEAILRWGGEGVRTWRLEVAIASESASDVDDVVAGFEADAARLREIASELQAVAPAAAASAVLRDPDRLAEAEALLWSTRFQQQPMPQPVPGLTLSGLGAHGIEGSPVSTARKIAAGIEIDHDHPLALVHGPAVHCTHYLSAIGHEALDARPALRVGMMSGRELVGELASASQAGYTELWRRRYDELDLLLLDGLEAFASDEPAQEVLGVLLDALLSRGAQAVLASLEPARRVPGLHPRFVRRLEACTTVNLSGSGTRRLFAGTAYAAAAATAQASSPDTWFFDGEKIAWDWVALDDRLLEEIG